MVEVLERTGESFAKLLGDQPIAEEVIADVIQDKGDTVSANGHHRQNTGSVDLSFDPNFDPRFSRRFVVGQRRRVFCGEKGIAEGQVTIPGEVKRRVHRHVKGETERDEDGDYRPRRVRVIPPFQRLRPILEEGFVDSSELGEVREGWIKRSFQSEGWRKPNIGNILRGLKR